MKEIIHLEARHPNVIRNISERMVENEDIVSETIRQPSSLHENRILKTKENKKIIVDIDPEISFNSSLFY